MSQTILIENNEDLRKIFSINLNTFTGTDVIHRKNAEDTIELLRILPQVSLIITQASVEREQTALKIFHFIKQENLTTHMIVLGPCPQISDEVLCLQEPTSWEILIKQAAQYLGVALKDVAQKVVPDFSPVNINFFYDIQQTPCDVYIRIKKSQNEFQFVKRIHSKDHFDSNAIKKYEEQGLKEFFIPKDYLQYFTTFLTNNLIQKLERTDLGLEERILTTANGHEIVRESIQAIGFNEAAIELSDASINSMIKSLKDTPEVVKLLKFVFSSKITYAYQHCHILALMCHNILSKQSWYRPEHLETLSFVSFFSDITLKSSTQMQISSMQELAQSSLTEEEKHQVIHHAQDAVALLATHPDANDYIKTVLMQSHGKLDGIGIEDNPNEDLHPLSKVFIVADNFVKILFNPHLTSNKKEILEIMGARFTYPSYQKIIKALEQKFD